MRFFPHHLVSPFFLRRVDPKAAAIVAHSPPDVLIWTSYPVAAATAGHSIWSEQEKKRRLVETAMRKLQQRVWPPTLLRHPQAPITQYQRISNILPENILYLVVSDSPSVDTHTQKKNDTEKKALFSKKAQDVLYQPPVPLPSTVTHRRRTHARTRLLLSYPRQHCQFCSHSRFKKRPL